MLQRNRRRRVALVVPRAGENIFGGAEAFCLTVARELASVWDVEIITTCAAEYGTWANSYAPGPSSIAGIPVRRFGVDAPRNGAAFDRLSRSLRYRLSSLTIDEQEAWLKAQGPYSTDLLRYLIDAREDYEAFFFFTYLYATTYFGLPLVRDRAFLVPLAHDEWPIYFPAWRNFFSYPQGFIFVSPEEREFAGNLIREPNVNGGICYPPIHVEPDNGSDAFRAQYKLATPFMLYIGRIDESKGCRDLCETFASYAATPDARPLTLVLAGPLATELPSSERIRYIGPLDETAKWAALRACEMFTMPSRHESLSLALLEAWACGKPAIVNGWSSVLIGQCRRSNGGLWYRDQASFNAIVQAMTPDIARALGRQGQAYVSRVHGTGNVVEAFSAALNALNRSR